MPTRSISSWSTGPRTTNALLLLLSLGACKDKGTVDSAAPADSTPDTSGSTTGERWVGSAHVRVVDPDGLPVEGVLVMQGGAPEERWVVTDAQGEATLEVDDDGITDRWILAGGEGWRTGGENLYEDEVPPDPLEIKVHAAPTEDNPAYHFQPGGTGASMDSSECGHCHNTIADGWAASSHQKSASNTRTWDLYTGSASELDAAGCAAIGGWLADGQEPGQSGPVREACDVGVGVLPGLNEGCGAEGETACDHPDARDALLAFGSCGDCHAPAVDGAVPGAIDLAAATGVAHEEGVTCDLCHKVVEVTAGGAPGLDGAIRLLRPSEPTGVTGQEFDPITFGPYPDVVVPIMKGSYSPGMREAAWCSACHEYARGSLGSLAPVDAARWPDGLPLHESWSEWDRSTYGGSSYACHKCHMEVLDEESSTYNISATGLEPSVDQGWLREQGDVRQHNWPGGGQLAPPTLGLTVDWTSGAATLTVANDEAGHAVPTGEPMRQYLLLVEIEDASGVALVPASGPTVPEVGGALAVGTVGEDLTVDGVTLSFSAGSLPAGATAVRFVRPTGGWATDPGPGAPWQDGLTDAERGLALADPLGEVAVSGVSGGTVTLASAAPATQAGDQAFLVGEDDEAGTPGWLFGKVLVDADGAVGVAHYRAVDIQSDNRIAQGDTVSVAFELPAEAATLRAQLVYRPYAAPIAHLYGWRTGDVESGSVEETRP